jgi:hypothetical protein
VDSVGVAFVDVESSVFKGSHMVEPLPAAAGADFIALHPFCPGDRIVRSVLLDCTGVAPELCGDLGTVLFEGGTALPAGEPTIHDGPFTDHSWRVTWEGCDSCVPPVDPYWGITWRIEVPFSGMPGSGAPLTWTYLLELARE